MTFLRCASVLALLILLLTSAVPALASHTSDGVIDDPRDYVSGEGSSFRELVDGTIVPIVDTAVIPLLYALAFLFFVYGIAKTFFSFNEEKRKEGKTFALWGIIALVLLFSVWGFVKLLLGVLQNGFG